MKEIWQTLLNPAWWFGTVIIAFLINLASDYSKPVIDRILSKFSHSRRESNEKNKREFEEHLSKLESEPIEVVFVEIRYTRSILQAGLSFIAILFISFVQSIATELRLAPYLDFMSDATILVQMFLKNTIFFWFFSILLLLSGFFSAVIFITSNRKLSFLRDLLSEYNRRQKKVKNTKS